MLNMKHGLFIAFIIMTSSCGQLLFDRSYLAEMEHEDGRMFEPSHDFPVVAGDTGTIGLSDKERQERTPASIADMENNRANRSLKQELQRLEGSQSEKAFEYYDKHKAKLPTVSERIYFLKLPHSERREYLQSRGVIEEQNKFTALEKSFGIKNTGVALGMSKDDVRESWGKPTRVEIAGNPSYENERWLYTRNGASKYIYFESGRVGGWE